MTKIADLRCRCGEVEGRVHDASPETVNRVVCYCDDCQAFAHYLGRADLLDAQGGSDIVQVAPSTLSFHRGKERIEGVRLGPKGLHRWYASCCKTPLGNTVGPAIPFIGILAQGFDVGGANADSAFGKPVSAILGKFAIGTPPEGSTSLNFGFVARTARLIASWKFGRKTWPHPYYDAQSRTTIYPLTTVDKAEREALRKLCGPRSA